MSKFQYYVPQPLGVYKELFSGDRHYQNYQLEHCKGDMTTFIFSLPADGTDVVIPTMVMKRPSGGGAAGTLFLRKVSGGSPVLFTSPAHSIVALDDTSTWEALVFTGEKRAYVPDYNETYYFTVGSGSDQWYTDTFRFVPSDTINAIFPPATLPSPCGNADWLQISWSNPNCVISATIPNTVTFSLNLQASMAQPQYEYKPEQEEDGEGGQVTTFQRLDKRWELFVLAPEYIADALTSVQMFSNVSIVFQYGDTLECRDVEVDVDWETPCFAKITFRFTADFLVKTACC